MSLALLQPSQSAALEAFLALVFGEEFRDMARQHIGSMFTDALSRQIFLVQTRGDNIIAAVGFSEALFCTDTWGIGWVAVHPDFRKQGIGTAVVKAALHEIAQRVQRPSTVLLSVYPHLAFFYERLGFSGGCLDHEGSPYLGLTIQPA